MSDREKIAYYRKNGMDSLADNCSAIMRRNEGNGENQRLTKLNSHNYDKLDQARGLDSESAKDIKESFGKWNPDAKPGTNSSDESLGNHAVLMRHALKAKKQTLLEINLVMELVLVEYMLLKGFQTHQINEKRILRYCQVIKRKQYVQ